MLEINVNELRIGSIVGIANYMNFKAVKVTEIRKERVLVEGSVGIYSSKNHKIIPIEISEEWLLKLGFEVYYESQFCKRLELTSNTEICYAFSNVEAYKGAVGFSYVGKVVQNIKFLHQLQNLYFALTGSELVFSTEP